jgi:hypothetical protein
MNRCMVLCAAALCPVLLGSTAAVGQWWWPPQQTQVDPGCPHPASNVIVKFSGEWNDHCAPNAADVFRDGPVIDIHTRRDPFSPICFTVITPYVLPVEVGQLPAGQYSVYVTHYAQGSPVLPRRLVATFSVDPTCPSPGCYANCDNSTTPPILNVEDFTCFVNEFAAGLQLPPEQQVGHYANCDGSTTAPVLNVEDFTCFINKFAQGCP